MGILVDKNTKVICQGFTGKNGTFHSEQAIAYGTKMVGGTSPGKGGSTHLGLPVFDTVAEAKAKTGADASVIYVPPPGAADAISRGDRGGDPADRLHHRRHPGRGHGQGEARAVRLEVAADRAELPGRDDGGRMQDRHHAGIIFKPGKVGIVSRSGTLTYEAVFQTTREGLGQTTALGIGGDPVKGMDFIEGLEMFLADKATEAIVMIGEIGGSAEEDAAQFLKDEAKRAARSRWSASSPAAPRRPAAAWAMPARSSRAARATPSPRSRRWKRPESRYRRRRRGSGGRWSRF